MTRRFLDSGTLIAAARGEPALQRAAINLLADSDTAFLTSPFVYLEAVPKAVFFGRRHEANLYRAYFSAAEWTHDAQAILAQGTVIAETEGVGPMDSLHVAAALLLGADEVVTVERPGRAIYRTKAIRVRHLLPR